MRWTRFALSIFGAGLVIGLAVVVTRVSALARVASLSMMFGIIALPVGVVIDWRRAAKLSRPRVAAAGRSPGRGSRHAVRAGKSPPPKR